MFSIIIPYYNQKDEYLKQCLDSIEASHGIHNQETIEIILINDGGEPTQLDLSQYCHKIEHIQNKTNQGPGAARNLGILAATEKYIIFLDSDDMMADDGLWQIFDTINSTGEPDIVYSDKMILYNNENQEERVISNNFPDNIHGLCIKKQFLEKNKITFLPKYYHEDGFFTLMCNLYNPYVQMAIRPVVRHRYFNWTSMSAYKNTWLYGLSLAASVITEYYTFFDVKTRAYLYGAHPSITNDIISRLQSFLVDYKEGEMCLDAPEMQYYIYLLTAIWLTLPMDNRQQILDKMPEIKQYNFYTTITPQYTEETIALLDEICKNENSCVFIKEYLIEQCKAAAQLQQELLSLPVDDVTIVVPTYNNTPTQIQNFFNSVNKQVWVNHIHVIVVNDGSTNGTNEKLVRECAGPNLDITYLEDYINYGVGHARQKGLKQVNTPYVMIFDMDDELYDSHIIYLFLSYMYYHPDCFAVRGWESFQGKLLRASIKECNTLHGLLCRVNTIKEFGLRFLPLQYVEDGLFLNECYLYQLPIITLPECFYLRNTGYLTERVEAAFTNLQQLTDTFCIVQRFSTLYEQYRDNDNIHNQEYADFALETITRLVYDFCNTTITYLPFDDATRVTRQYLQPADFTSNDRWMWKLYYAASMCRGMSKELLYKLRQSLAMIKDATMLYCVDNELLGIPTYLLQDGGAMDYRDLETWCKNWTIQHLAEVNRSDPEARIPPQVLKHFPWNYSI